MDFEGEELKPNRSVNHHIISRRANTIKSFGTAEEHRKIADYIDGKKT